MFDTQRGTLRILNDTFRGYRRYVGVLVLLGILGAGLDGIGINAIVPLASFLLVGSNALPTDIISRSLAHLFSLVGISFTFRHLLIFIALLFILRAFALALFMYIRGYISASFLSREVGTLFRWTMQAQWPFMVRQKAGNVQNSIFIF